MIDGLLVGLDIIVWSPLSSIVISFVDRRFLDSASKWPFAVATLLGRCLEMSFVVKPGQESRCSLRMARSKVDVEGLSNDAAKYCAISYLVL